MSYILHLCGWYPSKVDEYNGDFVQRHIISISQYVPCVVLFAVKDTSRSTKGVICERKQNKRLDEWIYYYPQHKAFDALWSQKHYLSIFNKAIKEIAAHYGKPLAIHLHVVWKAGMWALQLKRWKIPLIITEHSTAYLPEASPNLDATSSLRRSIFKKVYAKANFLTPVSAHLGNAIQARFGKLPYEVIPNAVDTSIFFPSPEASATSNYHILHVSTMNFQKNIEGILRVVDEVIEQFPQARFTMVGPVNEQLKEWWHEKPVREKQVHFTGWQPYQSVAQLMKSADLLFLFSRFENLPCVLLEAFCSGLPVISTNVGGISEVVNEENGILVKEGDETALLQAIGTMIKNEKNFDRKKISEYALATYSYPAIGRAFLKAYQKAGILHDQVD